MTNLKTDTEREWEGDDDHEPGDGGEEPATHPNARLRVVSVPSPHGGVLLPVDADRAHVRPSLAILVTSIGVNLNNDIILVKYFEYFKA